MKIMFYMDWGLAITWLEPVYDYFKKQNPDDELFFAADDNESFKILNEKNLPVRQHPYEYDFAICCDKLSACPRKNRIVIFHGIASKGQDFCIGNRRVYPTDMAFVASEYYKKVYIEMDGAAPDRVKVSGLTKFDTIKEIPKRNEIPKILYAPTHNPGLSSIPILGKSIYEITNLIIHLHYYTRNSRSSHHEPFRDVCDKHDCREDITDLMVNSDIVIADLGSTVLEALALGKMVIQVKNPEHIEWYSQKIQPEEINRLPEIDLPGRWAIQAKDINEVKAAISQYPNFKKTEFSIVENIGNYQASKIIYDYIKGC